MSGPGPNDVAVALHASVGLFIRRLRRAQPIRGELSLPADVVLVADWVSNIAPS